MLPCRLLLSAAGVHHMFGYEFLCAMRICMYVYVDMYINLFRYNVFHYNVCKIIFRGIKEV